MTLPRIIYTVLLLIALYSAYYLYSVNNTGVKQVNPNVELPALSGQNVDNSNYDNSGVRSYRITSAYLDHYAKSGDTLFKSPVLYVYKEGNIQEWQVTADHGILDQDHVLTLYDNVLAKNLLPDAAFDTMATEKLLIQLENRDFWADNPVSLVGPAFETTGQAMKGNLKENIATLYNHVQGKYEVQDKYETITP